MEQMKNSPRFTIFIPVKNGRNYIAPCVDSILAQTYKNFDLVILGGYSTDGTCAWLRTLEERDPRIKVIFSDQELGIEANWDRIRFSSKNEFMTIVGYDDLLERNFLEEICSLIFSKPEACLYQTHFKLIDYEGSLIRYCAPIPQYEYAAEFIAARMTEIRDSFGTGYVMRSERYDQLGGIPPYSHLPYADDALWVGLMGESFKVTSPRVCFSYRFHANSVSGTPDNEALFEGMSQYLAYLQKLAKGNLDIARVLEIYAPKFVSKRCNSYYYHLVKMHSSCNLVPQQKIQKIKSVLEKFAPQMELDNSFSKLRINLCRKLIAWLSIRCE
jgi:glycosyltransferase involved in cell wall biosynthesis